MTVLDQLEAYGKTDRITLVNREKRLSYRELDERSDAFACWQSVPQALPSFQP